MTEKTIREVEYILGLTAGVLIFVALGWVDRPKRKNIPSEIRTLAQDVISSDNLDMFWFRKYPELGGRSPDQMWSSGKAGRDRVLGLIMSAKSGDMA